MKSNRGADLIRQGIECGHRHELERGILFLAEGLEYVDERLDPRLALSAYHNMAIYFVHLGHVKIARGLVIRARSLYRRVEDPVMEARLVWLQGTIARVMGNFPLAVSKHRQAVEAFASIGEEHEETEALKDLLEVERLRDSLNSDLVDF